MQPTPGSVQSTSATVLSRALRSKGGRITPEGARFILDLGINARDKKELLRLLTKQRSGRITVAESGELESYV
jgi:hypothetical protein